MVAFDTSVWTDWFNGTDNRDTDLPNELLDDRIFRRARKALNALVCEPVGGRDIAIGAALDASTIPARGVSVPGTAAKVIATFCIVNGHALLHADRPNDTQAVSHAPMSPRICSGSRGAPDIAVSQARSGCRGDRRPLV